MIVTIQITTMNSRVIPWRVNSQREKRTRGLRCHRDVWADSVISNYGLRPGSVATPLRCGVAVFRSWLIEGNLHGFCELPAVFAERCHEVLRRLGRSAGSDCAHGSITVQNDDANPCGGQARQVPAKGEQKFSEGV